MYPFCLSVSLIALGPGECPSPVQGAKLGLGDRTLQTTHGPAADMDVFLCQQLVQLLPTEAPAAHHSHTIR